MITSRRLEQDLKRTCAKCKFLRRVKRDIIVCGIDGQQVPDAGALTMTTCDKWKGV